jgi:hypothetical protein
MPKHHSSQRGSGIPISIPKHAMETKTERSPDATAHAKSISTSTKGPVQSGGSWKLSLLKKIIIVAVVLIAAYFIYLYFFKNKKEEYDDFTSEQFNQMGQQYHKQGGGDDEDDYENSPEYNQSREPDVSEMALP